MKMHYPFASRGPQPQVRLFTKPGCHLCEQAQADLARLGGRYPHALETIDITAAPDLQRDYGERIPVLVIADREYAAPLAYAEIERALADATSSLARSQEVGRNAS